MQNVVVAANKILAQNSQSSVDLTVDSGAIGAGSLRVQIFSTSDPGASTHWLKQVRIGIHADSTDGSRPRSVSAQSRHSVESVTSVVTLHACDRRSCLGCGTLKLQVRGTFLPMSLFHL